MPACAGSIASDTSAKPGGMGMAVVTADPDATTDTEASPRPSDELTPLRRATRRRWGVPDALQTEALHQLTGLLEAPTSERAKLSAVRTLAVLDQADERHELA